MKKNIFLIGPMGAGKTTIGRCLARELQMTFYDSDQVVEHRTGADINWIFDIEGEEGFRRREQQVIEDLTRLQGVVLATGGGTIVTAENRVSLSARGVVIYLKVSLDQQFQRTQNDKKRPLLRTGGDLSDRLLELANEREPFYEEIADLVLETNGESIRSIVRAIVDYVTQ